MGVLKRKQENEAITFKLPAALKREIDSLRSQFLRRLRGVRKSGSEGWWRVGKGPVVRRAR